jgi:hypothetical protein
MPGITALPTKILPGEPPNTNQYVLQSRFKVISKPFQSHFKVICDRLRPALV